MAALVENAAAVKFGITLPLNDAGLL